MKIALIAAALAALTASSAFAGNQSANHARKPASEDIDINAEAMRAFFRQIGSLKSPDNNPIAELFADDVIQHFSGSQGNRVRISCNDPGSCELKVAIFFGHHGEENGVVENVTYKFDYTQTGKTVKIGKVTRISEEKN